MKRIGGDTNFSFEQEQKNRCSGSAECSNDATITFNVPVNPILSDGITKEIIIIKLICNIAFILTKAF